MFDHKPSEKEVAKWFSSYPLHEGLEHQNYIAGIIPIENKIKGGSVWSLYVNAAARIAYFWDFVNSNDFSGDIRVTGPVRHIVDFPEDRTSNQLIVRAEVRILDGEVVIRQSSGHKQVDTLTFIKGWNNNPGRFVPDMNSVMKAETGAVARALGFLGMLTLPGSGIATAEDMLEFTQSQAQDDNSKKEVRAVPNPKR